jgi:uncharacterized protein (TIGR02246 family)
VTAAITRTLDEAQIRQLIDDWTSALSDKDMDRVMAHYAPDVVVFDVKPPFQITGADAWRRAWEACLPYIPTGFQIERRDLRISVSGDLALVHCLFRLTGMEKDHPAMQTWMRSTACYQRKKGKWLIIHEHASLPFNPETSKVVFTLEP